MIRFEQVCKRYSGSRKSWVLEDLNLEIPSGEMIFLLGASGAGKTTLLKLITLEERPTEGRVSVHDFSSDTIRRRQIPELRRRCGVVYQDFRLIRDKTVEQNIAYILQMTGVLDRNVLAKLARQVLADVGLFPKRNDYPEELSGGEQQRAAIARALVHQPSIVLADEPTGNLDQEMGYEILQVLRRVNLAGATVIVASHDHDLALRFAERIVVLENGRVRSDQRLRSAKAHIL